MKIFTYDFWFSKKNIFHNFMHIVIGFGVYLIMHYVLLFFYMTSHPIVCAVPVLILAIGVEIDQRRDRDITSNKLWKELTLTDGIRDIITYLLGAFIAYSLIGGVVW